jgi:hypothetical protein
VAVTGARVSEMAKDCFWITTSPQFANYVHTMDSMRGICWTDVWPTFPVLISTGPYYDLTEGEDNIVAALKHSDRIHKVEVTFRGSPQLKKVLAAMREPFPELSPLAAQVEC